MIEKHGITVSVPIIDYELVEVSRVPPTEDQKRAASRARELLRRLKETGLFYIDADGEPRIEEPQDDVTYRRVPCDPRPDTGDSLISSIIRAQASVMYASQREQREDHV